MTRPVVEGGAIARVRFPKVDEDHPQNAAHAGIMVLGLAERVAIVGESWRMEKVWEVKLPKPG